MKLTVESIPEVNDREYIFDTRKISQNLLQEAKKRGFHYNAKTPYNRLFKMLFFSGGRITPKKGIDPEFYQKGLRYLCAFMRSFTPSQQDKEAVSALLLSEIAEIPNERQVENRRII